MDPHDAVGGNHATLKKYLALATVASDDAAPGTELSIEVTCEYERHRATARIVRTPFFEPERKKGLPSGGQRSEVRSTEGGNHDHGHPRLGAQGERRGTT